MEGRKYIASIFLFLMNFWFLKNSNACNKRVCEPYEPPQVDSKETSIYEQECHQNSKRNGTTHDAKANISTVEEIESEGYNVSTHTILSSDGYYTTTFRISGGFLSPPRQGKQSVLLFHGLSCSGKSWMIQAGKRNLAFILADAGYDVWLTNARGSTPSMNHTDLNARENISYWNFSFEEMGTLDLPPLVELILTETGNEKVYYICHSAGCAVFLSALSELPQLNTKFKASFMMAPAAYLGTGYGLFVKMTWMVDTPIKPISFKYLKESILHQPSALSRIFGYHGLESFCSKSALRCGLCDKGIFTLYGADPEQLNFTNIPNIISKVSDNLVWKEFIQFSQNMLACSFNKYDYGRKWNLKKYGSPNPPKYSLEEVKVPIHIYYGESDALVTPWDAERLRDAIPSKYMKSFNRVDWPLFTHIDFLVAKDADFLVYNKILGLMNAMETKSLEEI